MRGYYGLGLVLFIGIASCAIPPKTSELAQPVSGLRIEASPAQVEPGHACRITVYSNPSALSVILQHGKRTYPLSAVNESLGCYEGFIALPLETAVGLLPLKIIVPGLESKQEQNFDLVILPRSSVPTVYLNIKNFNQYRFAPESRLMAQARQKASYYTGLRMKKIKWPLSNIRLTGGYGVKRVYNHGQATWYHGGIDLAAMEGTPVQAPADGKVILAEPFVAHGNTILIDHGFGITTTYLHLQTMAVATHDMVQTGQIIGEVGSTGASTASHLHFQVNVHDIAVDPEDFLEAIRSSSRSHRSDAGTNNPP